MLISEVNNEINALPQNLKPKPATAPRNLRDDEQPDFQAARNSLRLLDPAADKFVFQIVDNRPPLGTKAKSQTLHGTFDELAQDLWRWNRQNYGVYVTVNRSRGARRRKEDITDVRAVWRELDAEPAFGTSIEPSITVQTSPGKTHEWFFVDHLSLDGFDGVQRCLVEQWESDPSAKDRARVLRLPGFYHLKADPHMVRIVAGDGRRYSPIEILDAFEPIYHSNSAPQIDGDLEFTPVARALVESWIEAIDGAKIESRDDWLRFGAAFARLGDDWQSDDGEDLRLDLWHRLSMKAPHREHGETGCHNEGMWEDRLCAAANSCDRKATYRSILHAARESGWCQERSGLASEHAVEVWEIISGCKAGLDGIDFETLAAIADEDEGAAPVSEAKQVEKPTHGGAWEGPPPLSARDLAQGDFPPAEWLIHNLLLEGKVNLLYGDGGIGKTSLSLHEAVCIASGKPMFGREVKQRPVLLILAEDDNGPIKKRLNAICPHYGVELANLELLNAWCLPGYDIRIARADNYGEITLLPFYHRLHQELLTMPGGFLVLDSMADVGSMDEANRESVNAYLKRVVGKLCIDCNVTIEVLGHPSKTAMQDGSGYSGGTAFNAAVRHRKYLGRAKDSESKEDPRRVYEVAKTNYGREESIELSFRNEIFYSAKDAGATDRQEEIKGHVLETVLRIIDDGTTIVRTHGSGVKPGDIARKIKQDEGITVSAKEVLAVLNDAQMNGLLKYCQGQSHGRAGFQRSVEN